jgi:hypothetical protein
MALAFAGIGARLSIHELDGGKDDATAGC